MRSLVKKINTRLAFVYYTNGNEMDEWYAMTSHVIAYRSTELLFGTHTFNFNCFFGDFNCIFRQIRCLSRLLINSYKATEIIMEALNIFCSQPQLLNRNMCVLYICLFICSSVCHTFVSVTYLPNA